MYLLSSMLITATLIGGSQIPQANCSSIDASALQEQLKNNCIESQVIVGNACDVETILGDLGILNNCESTPLPDNGTVDTPENETPDNSNPNDSNPDNSQPEDGTVDTQPDESTKSYVEQVVELVNAERAKENLPALTMSQELNHAAQIRAVETTQSFSHTRPNGSSFSSVLSENGISYRGAGENIAWGQKTPEEVVNAWMNSEGHRANILNKNFTTIGVGYYLNGSTPYWAQLFTY